jgi:hypothetical protein
LKKGVILEVNAQYVSVLTPEGEFLKARKLKEDYNIGEEIDFFPLNERGLIKKRFFNDFGKLRIALASSIAAILLFFSAFSFYDSNQVYAYMSIDINPSIEVAVDKKLRVITLKAYNEEGKLILADLEEWKNNSIANVTKDFIQKSKASGYFEDGAEVIIATVVVDDEGAKLKGKLDEDVNNLAQEYKAENVMITVMDRKVQDRELAIGLGLTTGKYVKEFLLAKEVEPKLEEKPEDQPVKEDKPAEITNKEPSVELKEELPKVNIEENDKVKVIVDNKNDDDEDHEQDDKGNKGPPEKVKEKITEVREKVRSKQNEKKDDDDDEDNNSNRDDRDNDQE